VYDFRNPPGGIVGGFRWSEIDPNWKDWTASQYREGLQAPLAQRGFNSDFDGMKWADVGVLLLPCGRSAHLELGWMAGAGKPTVICTHNGEEPELMALLATTVCVSLEELLEFLQREDR
jgi:nucleoside 2-deoxyribosyltransferase